MKEREDDIDELGQLVVVHEDGSVSDADGFEDWGLREALACEIPSGDEPEEDDDEVVRVHGLSSYDPGLRERLEAIQQRLEKERRQSPFMVWQAGLSNEALDNRIAELKASLGTQMKHAILDAAEAHRLAPHLVPHPLDLSPSPRLTKPRGPQN